MLSIKYDLVSLPLSLAHNNNLHKKDIFYTHSISLVHNEQARDTRDGKSTKKKKKSKYPPHHTKIVFHIFSISLYTV